MTGAFYSMAYKLNNFLDNVSKIALEVELKKRNQGLGLIMNSLQAPASFVIQALLDRTEKMKKDKL